MALYPEKNVNMYQRISTRPEGFLRIIPFTVCYFGNYEFYNGVEFDMNYRFPNNRLDDYEDRVSTELNKCLRHHAGVDMTNPKLGLKNVMTWVGSTSTTSSSTSVSGAMMRDTPMCLSWTGDIRANRTHGTRMKLNSE